jgi:hypothetical protein
MRSVFIRAPLSGHIILTTIQILTLQLGILREAVWIFLVNWKN